MNAQNASRSTIGAAPDASPPSTPNAQQGASCAQRIRLAFASHSRAPDVTPWAGTFDDLEAVIRKDGATLDGKDGHALLVSEVRFGDGQTKATMGRRGFYRQKHLVTATWLLGLDYDSREGDPLAILAPLREAGLDVIAYSTHSHGVAAKGPAPRFRALVPFTRSVTADELRVVHAYVDAMLGGGSDPSVDGTVRLFFTARRKAREATLDPWIVRWRGAALDPDALPGDVSAAELLAAESRATARTPSSLPRFATAPAEAERRIATLHALDDGERGSASKRAHNTLAAALRRMATASPGDRHNWLFKAGARIGEWSAVLGPEAVRHYRDAVVDQAQASGYPYDRAECERCVDDGIVRGQSNPVDVRAMLDERDTRSLPIVDDDDAGLLEIDDARERVREAIGQALAGRGAVAVAADPGAGKTEAVVRAIGEIWRAGLDVRIALPTNKLADDVLDRVLRHTLDELSFQEGAAFGAQAGREPTRHEKNCTNFDAVMAGRRAAGAKGARMVCGACPFNPANIPTEPVVDGNGKTKRRRVDPTCRFFREVAKAKQYRVTVTTHEMELLRVASEAHTYVDDAAFRRADLGKRYRPAAEWTAEGLALSLVEDEQGAPPPELRWRGMARPPAHRLDDVRLDERDVLAWLAEADGRPCAPDLDSLRAKYEPEATGGVDLVVIDERPDGADQAVKVDERDVLVWRGAGDLAVDDDKVERFRNAVALARKLETTLMSSSIAALLPPGSVTVARRTTGEVQNTAAEAELVRHARPAGEGDPAAVEELKRAPPMAALEALEAACARRWAGCYLDGEGTLHITTPRKVTSAAARATLYLDGTTTRATSRALLGPETRFVRVPVALHDGTRAHRVTWSASKNELPPPPKERADDVVVGVEEMEKRRKRRAEILAQRRDTLNRLRAVVKRYDGAGTAWVLHKAWTEDAEAREVFRDALDDGRVTYFGAPDAVGSNRFRGCSRIVLADWYVPRVAKEAAAELLADRARGDRGLAGAEWYREAERALEDARIMQAAYRVRPGEAAREIVCLTTRGLAVPRRWRAPDVDPDELLADELGIVPPGPAGAALLLRRAVEADGFVVVAASGCGFKGNRDFSYVSLGGTRVPLETALQSHPGGTGGAARDAGLSVAYVRTSDGSALPVVWGKQAPTAEQVAGALVARGVTARWFLWRDVRFDVDDGSEAVLAALRSLASPAVSWEGLAAALGVSTSTARRRAAALGVSSLDALRARWSALHRPPDVVLDTPEGPAVALVGGAAWLALAPSADVARWRSLSACACSFALTAGPKQEAPWLDSSRE